MFMHHLYAINIIMYVNYALHILFIMLFTCIIIKNESLFN